MIAWNFPSNGGGQIRGVADSGIETFRGKEISSLAREICQNSLDAVANENSFVTVEFQRYDVDTETIPDVQAYVKILQACQTFWVGNKKAKTFFDAAILRLRVVKTSVLRISDFNTTGLAEPFNPRAMTGWNTLTKIDGGATKDDTKAGSFGIGKNAPFANSFLRMVFYRTLNISGERAAQGMARLVSFQQGDEISTGTGYFGESQGNMPVRNISALENIYRRELRGTDVFVYGFNGGDFWKEDIFVELVENFLVALHRDKLRVTLQGIRIDKNTLGDLLHKYENKIPNAANYYKILTGDVAVKTFETDFHGMGKLKLGVLTDSTAKFNRKVLIVRKSGMKLFELDRISRTLNFTAILELEGRKLNAFFREMETPSHDKWEPTRYERNRSLAKKYLDELKRWVRDTISKLGEANISDETDVEGLGNMLDFDHGAIGGGSSTAVETFGSLGVSSLPQELSPDDGKPNSTLMTTGGDDNSTTRRTRGDVTDTGGFSAIRTPDGRRPRRKLDNHSGKENPDGDDIVSEPVGKKIACNKIRVIRLGAKSYRLILKVPRKIASGRIEISAVGESNAGEKLFVTQAAAASNIQINSAGDAIAFQNLRGDADATITFELQDAKNYALGVAVHED